MNFLENTVSFL